PNGETAGPGEVFVRSGGQWTLVEDNRGTRYWTAEAGLATQDALGPMPPGATEVAGDAPDLVHVDGVWKLRSAATPRELAAGLALTRLEFFAALSTSMATPLDTVDDALVAQITAAEGAGALTAADAQTARGVIKHARVFHREDTAENKRLLEQLAALVGIAAPGAEEAALDALFLSAAAV
ncbi:MAG: hypothetical protein AAFR16_06480, partial [Pseudomonadota bacterium]